MKQKIKKDLSFLLKEYPEEAKRSIGDAFNLQRFIDRFSIEYYSFKKVLLTEDPITKRPTMYSKEVYDENYYILKHYLNLYGYVIDRNFMVYDSQGNPKRQFTIAGGTIKDGLTQGQDLEFCLHYNTDEKKFYELDIRTYSYKEGNLKTDYLTFIQFTNMEPNSKKIDPNNIKINYIFTSLSNEKKRYGKSLEFLVKDYEDVKSIIIKTQFPERVLLEYVIVTSQGHPVEESTYRMFNATVKDKDGNITTFESNTSAEEYFTNQKTKELIIYVESIIGQYIPNFSKMLEDIPFYMQILQIIPRTGRLMIKGITFDTAISQPPIPNNKNDKKPVGALDPKTTYPVYDTIVDFCSGITDNSSAQSDITPYELDRIKRLIRSPLSPDHKLVNEEYEKLH